MRASRFFDPVAIGAEARIVGDFGHAGDLRVFAELPVIADRDDDEAVLGGEGLIGHDIRMGIAEAPGRRAADQEIERLIGEHRDLGIEQSKVEILAFAGPVTVMKRAKHADRGIEPGEHIGEGDTGLDRLGARRPSGRPVIDMMPPMPWIMKS